MRPFVVTLFVLIVGLFVGLALLDLVNILMFTRASAHSIGKIFSRVALAGVTLIVGVLPRGKSR